MPSRYFVIVRIVAVALLIMSGAVMAAEVKLLAGEGIAAVIEEIGPRFERATGNKLTAQYGLAPNVKRRIESGEAFDVVILSTGPIDDLLKQGKILDGRTPIAKAGIGVGVRAGAPKPDVGSIEGFKRAMLEAKGISYAPESTSGVHLAKVFDRLGISEQARSKAKPQKVSSGMGVISGEADVAVGLSPQLLSTAGIDFAGHLPSELQNYLVFTGAVSASSSQRDAAEALIRYLTAPESLATVKAKGWEPAGT